MTEKGPVSRAYYPHSFKIEAVSKAVDQGLGLDKTAEELGIPKKTLATWIRNYKSQGEQYKYAQASKHFPKVKKKPAMVDDVHPILTLRIKKNISQQELGELLGGLHNSTVGRYETRKAPIPELVRRELNRLMKEEGLPEILPSK